MMIFVIYVCLKHDLHDFDYFDFGILSCSVTLQLESNILQN